MQQKYKIIIANFEKEKSTAIAAWLNDAEGFVAKAIDFGNQEDVDLAKSENPNLILINSDCEEFDFIKTAFEESLPNISIGRKVPNNAELGNNHFNIPLRFNLLEARIRFVLRARVSAQMALVHIGEYELNPNRKSLMDKKGNELKLTDKEVDILNFLNLAGGEPVSREKLLRDVWHYNEGVTTHTLETHIYRLRQKLSTIIGDEEVLFTDDGGYRLKV